MLWLTHEPIDVDLIRLNVMDEGAGAVVIFEGRVRNTHQGKKVRALHYEAYPKLALNVFEQITNDAQTRWKLSCVDIAHRVGALKVGEVAVAVVVASPHRKEAFEACAFLIEELKKKAPIWKKEFYEDESEQWVGHGSAAGGGAQPSLRRG